MNKKIRALNRRVDKHVKEFRKNYKTQYPKEKYLGIEKEVFRNDYRYYAVVYIRYERISGYGVTVCNSPYIFVY